jgi:hypothetical protein
MLIEISILRNLVMAERSFGHGDEGRRGDLPAPIRMGGGDADSRSDPLGKKRIHLRDVSQPGLSWIPGWVCSRSHGENTHSALELPTSAHPRSLPPNTNMHCDAVETERGDGFSTAPEKIG